MKTKIFLLGIISCFLVGMLVCDWAVADVTMTVTSNSTTNDGHSIIDAEIDSLIADGITGVTSESRYALRVQGWHAGNAHANSTISKGATGLSTTLDMGFVQPASRYGRLDSEETIGISAVSAYLGGDPYPTLGQVGEYLDVETGSKLGVTELTEFESTGATVNNGYDVSAAYTIEESGEGEGESGLEGVYEQHVYQEVVEGEAYGPFGEPPCIRRTTDTWVQTEDTTVSYSHRVTGRHTVSASYQMGATFRH